MSYLNCDYYQALLKKKKMYDEQQTLTDLYEKAKRTIMKLTADMIEQELPLNMFFTYYKEVSRKNVIKLLLRCKRLYDARNSIVSILASLVHVDIMMEPDSVLWTVLQDKAVRMEIHMDMVRRCLRFLSATLTKISIFQTENKLFRGGFKFNDQDQVEMIVKLGSVIGGFLASKEEDHPALQSNGLLLALHNEDDNQA